MAVLSTIRKRVGLVIGFVGASMVLFILGDVLTSNQGLFGKNDNSVGVIAGEKIPVQEFESRVEKMIENYKASTQKDNLDENTTDMLRDQAWNMLLNESILGKEYQELGLSCSSKELYEMCTGKNVDPQVRQAFTDPNTGNFNPAQVINFLKDLPNRDEKTQEQWKNFEDALREQRISDKYKTLIKGGIYVTKAEAKNDLVEKGKLANIRFVQLSYMTVPDSAVKVEDSDLEAYYSAHKKTFEQKEAARKIDYVSFDVVPSAEDRNEVLQWITAKKEEFANAGNDTLFVNQYSDTPFDSSFHAKGTLPAVIDTQLFNAAPGTLIGPYEDGGKFKLSKLTVAAMVPDSVRARHILIKINNNDTAAARSKADSLLRIIRGGMPFEMLAMNNSEDPGSAVKGGDLGWFRKGMMVKPFEEACFNGKVGDMTIVRSQFGYHIIEVTGKGVPSRQVQVATVERAIEPSQKTYDAAYQAAMQFAAAVQGGAAFDSVAAKMGVEKRTAENLRESEKFIAGLDKPREIVRWAYTANLGDLSKVFTVGDKFVIATLVDIREKGFLPLDQVRDQVAAAVRKEKKGELLAEKFKEATGNASNLEAVAQKVGQSVFPAGNISFSNSYIQGMGNEPKVVGQIFAMNQGQLSKPVIGDGGVYVFVVDQLTVPSTTDEEAARKQLADSRRQRSDYEVFNALKEKANVVDRRGRFY